MSFLKKLFGKNNKGASTKKVETDEHCHTNTPITAFGANGEHIQIERETYRKNVLPGIFEEAQNNPNELYGAIIMALDDGFTSECIDPAIRLYEMDENHERGSTILGIVFLKNEKYKEAKQLYENYMKKHGESGVVLTNLAKAISHLGDEKEAEKVLWRSLELCPNLDNAVQWWAAIHRDRSGESGYLSALEKVAQLPESWYALLWLARNDLENNNLEHALSKYRKILNLAKHNSDALFMITGDLGKNGEPALAVELAFDAYDPNIHSVGVGLNLMQGCLETGKVKKGMALLEKMKKLGRHDITKHINYYEEQFSLKIV
jgi:tetratricopeptide (TPR) repeat protein